ncbi:MAG: hypothetical protein O7D32_02560 [bacterium]|nr:hypothetical protein [bacterium]
MNQHIIWFLNRIIIRCYSMWMTVMLAFRKGPDRTAMWACRARRSLTPSRIVFSAVVGAIVFTPSVLYLMEHSRYVNQKRAYRGLSMASAAESSFLQKSLSALLAEQAEMTELLLNAGYAIEQGSRVTVKVVATGYSSSIWECDDTPFTTASNTRTRNGILALSRDLISRYTEGAPFSFGDPVHVSGVGSFLLEDTMNERWRNRLDIWFPSRADALQFGIREVYLSSSIDGGDIETSLSASPLSPTRF